jgi:hypothetical protein
MVIESAGIAIFIIAGLIITIWILVEVKRMRHKIFALFLIALILFLYLSANIVFQSHEIDFKTVSGLTSAGKLYMSWLGSAFGNVKSITTNAIKMDWKGNATIG